MPELKCMVQTCTHNKQLLCELDKIQVNGNSAKDAEGTSCASFVEKKNNGGYSNSAGTTKASECSCVDCKATDCTYNNACQCQAGAISVNGTDACTSGETKCASFTCC